MELQQLANEELTAETYLRDLRALGFKVELTGSDTFGLWREHGFGPDYTDLALRYGHLLSHGRPRFYTEVCAFLARESSSNDLPVA